jgi:hypothetical protein
MMHPQRLLFRLGPTLILIFISLAGSAQDTLPAFSAEIKSKNRIIISWTNPYGTNIKQLSIQRSRDSSRLFKTIISIPDPTVLKNGFVDQNLPDTNFYYRVYIMLDGGDYVFSPVRKAHSIPPPPKHEPVTRKPEPPAKVEPIKPEPVQKPKPVEPEKPKLPLPQPEKYLVIKKGDEIVGELNERFLQRFRDSVSMRTKDTILLTSRDTLLIKPFQPKEVYGVSKYVFIDKAGLIHIELPWYARRKYIVKFFEEDRSPLFEIKEVRDAVLLLDKANFMQAGWYFFEIYEDGKLLEKNKLFVGKDF